MTAAGQAASEALRQKLSRIVMLEQQGNFAAALKLCEQLLAASPGTLPLQVFKARLLRQLGQLEAASDALAMAAEKMPQSAAVLGEQGKLALAEGRPGAACEFFTALVQMRPDNPEDWFNLGHASEGAQRLAAAAEAYQRAMQLGISAAEEVKTRLGTVLLGLGREDEALAYFEQALSANGRDYQALYGKGMIMQAQGDFAAAESLFLAAIEANPDFAEAYQQLAESRRFSEADAAVVARMRRLLDRSLADAAREKLHFALGKISNDRGDHDAAFEHFSSANALKRKRQPEFDRNAFRNLTRAIIEFFDETRLEFVASNSTRPHTPVFIVGMPRSGTTLIEQILSSHSEVSGAGELAFIDKLSRSALEDYPQGLGKLGAKALARMRDDYYELIETHADGRRYVTDKFPANFLHLGFISMLLPEARFIYCKRDAMDNCLSIFMQDFGTGNYYANDLEDIAFYYRCHEQVMAHWQHMFPDRLLQMDYERLVENQEPETRRLLKFLGLEWQAACLAFDKNPRKVATLSRWQVRQPMYKTAAGRWRRYEKHLAGLRAALAYPDKG